MWPLTKNQDKFQHSCLLSMTGIFWDSGHKSCFKWKMCPPEGFLPARHLGSSPTHQPCRRAWYHHRTGCKERPLFAEGVQGQRSVQQPQRWTCQREALAVPAATCKPSRQPPVSFQKTPQAHCHAAHSSGQGVRRVWFHRHCFVTDAACEQGGHLASNPLCGLQVTNVSCQQLRFGT